MIDIESRKALLSSGQYGNLITSNTKMAWATLDFIDAVCWLELVPELKADLNVPTLLDVDAVDGLEFVQVYRTTIAPWIAEWSALFANVPQSKVAVKADKTDEG